MNGRAGQRGQASVELALVMPVIAVVILGVVQVVLVLRDEVAVVEAAREAARTASVDVDPNGSAARAAATSQGLDGDRTTVTVRRTGGRVIADVRYRAATDAPLIGALLPDVGLVARTEMRDETSLARWQRGPPPLAWRRQSGTFAPTSESKSRTPRW